MSIQEFVAEKSIVRLNTHFHNNAPACIVGCMPDFAVTLLYCTILSAHKKCFVLCCIIFTVFIRHPKVFYKLHEPKLHSENSFTLNISQALLIM